MIKSTTSPIWNDQFDIDNIEEDDLSTMSAEITLLNRYKVIVKSEV